MSRISKDALKDRLHAKSQTKAPSLFVLLPVRLITSSAFYSVRRRGLRRLQERTRESLLPPKEVPVSGFDYR